jgi:hypothetical protein
MFLILLFLMSGGVFYAIDKIAPTFMILVAVCMIAVPIGLGLAWVYDHTGVTNTIESSVVWLSGQDSMGEIYPKEGCPPGKEATAWALVGVLVTLFNVAMAGLGFVGIALGVIVMILGLWPLVVHWDEWLFKVGVGIFSAGILGVILIGLGFWLLNWMYDGLICMPPSS